MSESVRGRSTPHVILPPYDRKAALTGAICGAVASFFTENAVCGMNFGCRVSYTTIVMILGAYTSTLIVDKLCKRILPALVVTQHV